MKKATSGAIQVFRTVRTGNDLAKLLPSQAVRRCGDKLCSELDGSDRLQLAANERRSPA